ncbi:hypothetical protein SAMN04487783_0496 [Agrococcus baldri]|uniref:Uncharacterized protein n=1 Tax=Agrococcus baldri TaxID=153730 RepID=A0AA94HKL1_9MICO|nr:hypothetical protein [Agrococcus baldri]SFS00900.1 hypothetical protein SAMN04487783_0496 [Agrococcus baldri]
MSRPIARRSWRGIVLGAVLLFGVSACATSGAAPSAPPPSTSTAVPTEDSADADAEVAAEVEVESAADAAATVETEAGSCDDAEFGDVAARPDPLAELGIPFYPCTREMTAMPGTDPLFVGEYVTDHELIIVEAAIVAQFDASDWEITDSTVEGDNAIRTAQMPGYSLVVVVGPERTNPDSSSIHYTLRAS